MKVNIKTVAIAIAAILTIGSVTLVSCNKDEETVSSKVATSAMPSMKGSTPFITVQNHLKEFYTACDNAYQENSQKFLEACEKSDSSTIMEMTGFTYDRMAKLAELSNELVKHFAEENPDVKDEETTCSSCQTEAHPGLGKAIAATDGKMSTLMPQIILNPDYGKEMMCMLRCGALPPCSQWFCFTNCMGWYYIDKYMVSVGEGDMCIGAYNKGKIVYAFEFEKLVKSTQDATGNQYVLETFEVADSILPIKTGMVEAHLVLYNVKEEVPESYWFPIKKVDDLYYLDVKSASNSNRGIKCKPNKKCDKGCEHKTDANGNFAGCICSGEGACKESEFVGDIIETLGDALEKVIIAITDLLGKIF